MSMQLKQPDLIKDYKVACMGVLGCNEIEREYANVGSPDDYFIAEGRSHQEALSDAIIDINAAGYIVPESLQKLTLDDTVLHDDKGETLFISVLVTVKVR